MFLTSSHLIAKPVSPDKARQSALAFLTTGKMKKVRNHTDLHLSYTINNKNGQPLIYGFNRGGNNGFIIVSADDVAETILGYSDSGCLDAATMPANLKVWLEEYAKAIDWAQTQGITEKPVRRLYDAPPAKAKSTVPYLLTSTWDQGAPYNDMCVFNGDTCATGCSATALAQIMYYWATKGHNGKKFRSGSRMIPGYEITSREYELEDLPALTSFDWDHMTDGKPVETASRRAVAQLMRYCGQAMTMMYAPNGSAAAVPYTWWGMKKYLNYNPSVRFPDNENMKESAKRELIYDDILHGRPVFMYGGSSVMHSFVCDGYDADTDKYHINWGWGGVADGYFSLDALQPGYYSFTPSMGVLTNINPIDPCQYDIYTQSTNQLTRYYDNKWVSHNWTLTSWNKKEVKTVVFDKSYANARPTTTKEWFMSYSGLVSVQGLQYLNTSQVTDMSYMFAYCESLETLDLSTLNTSNVTNMRSMFTQNYALKSVNLSKLDVSKVTNFTRMFSSCKKLTSLNLSNFVTSSATNMTGMFASCISLTSLNISKFVTSSVTDFTNMFQKCSSLKTLDLSHFSLSKVKNSNGMLSDCSSLSTLTIPSTMTKVAADVCTGVGSESNPCLLNAPQGFNYGTDVSGNYFIWKGGYFHIASDPRTAVDLGLSVKWATYNVGATTASDRGNYYAWGETSPKSKYTWANYAYADGSAATVRDIGSDIAGTSYDVAARLWGGDWRMPNISEIKELIQKCTFTETTVSGVKGYRVKGPNGKTIFLPFAGCSFDGSEKGNGTYAYYGCGDISESSLQKAYSMFIKTGVSATTPLTQRRTGIVIRPVQGAKDIDEVPTDENLQLVDLGLSVKWASQNINASKESDYGNYYAWGETKPKTTYTWTNYTHSYGSSSSARFIGTNISQTVYDAAYLSDPSLALPTVEQWNELISRCTWTLVTINGIKGYRVTGPSKKSIFLPLSGCTYDGKTVGVGGNTYYWSANNNPDDRSKAMAVFLKSSSKPALSTIQRRTGTAIRPVQSVVDYVDLGLPSGHLWAKYNLGATSEEQTGGYYAWGELTAKSDYTWNNYEYGSSKSCRDLGDISGDTYFDPASGKCVIIKSGSVSKTYVSQMPLKADFEELVSKCTVVKKTVNGVVGLRFTGPNGNSIFLPFTGSWYDGKKYNQGESAFYWSGSIYTGNTQRAYSLSIKSGVDEVSKCFRRTGLNIRPVFVPGSVNANEADFDTLDDIPIVSHDEDMSVAPVYNLQGMKMEGELPPGIYIRNGKKFVVK